MSYYEYPRTRDYDTDLTKLIDDFLFLDGKYASILVELERMNLLQSEIDVVVAWIANFNYSTVRDVVDTYIPSMILPEISEGGYFLLNVPDTWGGVVFNTTELDIDVALEQTYGHLVISY